MRKAPRLSAPSRSLTAGSFTTTNSQFCALLPVGALSASSITGSTSPSSTGSGLSRRIARWVRIASSSGSEKSGAAVGGAGLVSSMLGLLGADQSTTRARWKPARRLVYNPPHVARPARQGRRRRRRLRALRRALRAEPRGPPLRRGRRGARGCGLRAGAHRGGVGGHRHVHLRRRRARRRAQALRPPHDAGAELLRLGHGRLPQRLPRGRRRAVRRRARRRLREDARRRLRAPQPEPPRARLRRAGAARLRALRAPLLRAVRRLQEDARRGGGQEPQERHEEPEGAFEDGGERGDGAGRAHDLQPPRSLRLLPDDRRRRGGGRLPRGPGAILHGHAGVAPRDRARGGLGPALLQAELRLPRLEATVRAAEQAYAQAKVTPAQVDFAEVHDCFTITEILNYEDLGFCARGEGGRFVEEGRADLGGEKPVNPSGGLKSYGHPVGATGVRMIYELTTQLRGQAGARQVKGAKIGLAHNLGGPGAISCVSILTNQA